MSGEVGKCTWSEVGARQQAARAASTACNQPGMEQVPCVASPACSGGAAYIDLPVAVGVHRFKHLLVELELGAAALWQPDRTESPLELPSREEAAIVGVELTKDFGHIPMAVARGRRLPELWVKLSARVAA